MIIQIIPLSDNIKHLNNLIGFIERKQIEEVKEVKIKQEAPKAGEMSIGKLTNILVATVQSIQPLLKCLIDYVQIYKTHIIVKKDGQEIEINGRIGKDNLDKLINEFLND